MTPATDPRPRPAPGRAEGPTFAFHHVWRIAAPTPRVFEVLAAADRYAEWWPQIRSVTREGPDDGTALVRSVLPIPLTLHLHREVSDAETGHLAVRIAGDLCGWARWQVRPALGAAGAPATVADYRQTVVVAQPRLRRLAPPARLLFIANHSWMMRSGERGLRRHLDC